ncbi:glutathione S-transferase [Chloropicon primus]|uniref:Glutathione S-transferase n=1 Tax=Chloropicon primus TaxID=1764295 RepID=A0A5B8MKM6_9CHLO|nr:glutathione S-transferase [Chloropicon primus]UPR00149.1 glutathione S-transferase [Chloropicon primus]|eukprot:QDZ20939.1 glutathione S-transferase [Chloropicon primus]
MMMKENPGEHRDEMTLYTSTVSTCAWRVRIAMELKGLRYTPVAVDLPGGQQRESEFAHASANRQVPLLEVRLGGVGDLRVRITQSVAICEFLEERNAGCGLCLLPRDDPVRRARVREVVETVTSLIQPAQNRTTVSRVAAVAGAEAADGVKREAVLSGLHALERLLAGSAGDFAVGDEVSLADAFVVPQAHASEHVHGLDVASEAPTVHRVARRAAELPAFRAARGGYTKGDV